MLNERFLAAAAVMGLGVAAFAQGGPGTVSFVEGQAAVNGRTVAPGSVGEVSVQAGQMLATGNGRAAVELTPGVTLRVEKSSAVKLVVVDAAKSEVMLQSGRAEVVVAGYPGAKDVQIDTANGVQTVLLERGLYAFDAKAGELRVFDGKAAVSQTPDSKWVDVKNGHELALDGTARKPVEFDRDREIGEFAAGGGFETQPAYAYADGPANGVGGYGFEGGYGGFGYPGFGYGFGPGFGFYEPFGFGLGFYPGFYGGGFGYGGFRGGYGGFRGGRR